MKKYGSDSDRSISSSLSIIFIMVLSVWMAWFLLEKAKETIASAEESQAVNIQKRAGIK